MTRYKIEGYVDVEEVTTPDPPDPTDPPDTPTDQPYVIRNATFSDESGSYCAFSANNLIAYQPRQANAADLEWWVMGPGTAPVKVADRNQPGGVLRMFMWSVWADVYFSLETPGKLEQRDVPGTLVDSFDLVSEPGDQWRAGTAGGNAQQHLRLYRGKDIEILDFNVDGPTDSWDLRENPIQMKQLLQGSKYYWTPQSDPTQVYIADFDGSNADRIETPMGSPAVQRWSHPCTEDQHLIWLEVSGELEGWVRRRNATIPGEWPMFDWRVTRDLLGLTHYIAYQHGHLKNRKLIYSAHAPAENVVAIMSYDMATEEHKVLVPPWTMTKTGWTYWAMPSWSQDNTWFAYQREDDVYVVPMSSIA